MIYHLYAIRRAAWYTVSCTAVVVSFQFLTSLRKMKRARESFLSILLSLVI